MVLIGSILLYIPAVQNFAVKKASFYASESLGMRIDVGRIRLSFPLNLMAQDVSVTDAAQDTVLYVHLLTLNVNPIPLPSHKIALDGFHLKEARLNTKNLIDGVAISGIIGQLDAQTNGIDLAKMEAVVNRLELSDTDIRLRIDSIPSSPDTVQTADNWKISSGKIRLQRISFALQLPPDSMLIHSFFEDIVLTGGDIDMEAKRYAVSQLVLSNVNVDYDTGSQPVKEGFDPSHISVTNLHAGFDSLLYQGKEISALVHTFAFNERSGLEITSMNGSLRSDSTALTVPQWSLQTPYSNMNAQVTLPWTMLTKQPQGAFFIQIDASLDKRDILVAAGERAKHIKAIYPDEKLTFNGLLEGNPDKICLHELQATLPKVFQVEAHGMIEKMADRQSRSGELYLEAFLHDKNPLNDFLRKEYAGRFSVPDSMHLDIQATLAEGTYQTKTLLTEQQGKVALSGWYNEFRKEYEAELKADNLGLAHFLPKDSILYITASLQAKGRGTDFYADSTRLQLDGALAGMQYKNREISGISLDGSFHNHQIQASLTSEYPYARGTVTLDGNIRKHDARGMLIMDMDSLDLYGLGMSDSPLSGSFQIFSELETDLQKRHQFDITLGNWEITMEKQKIKPKTLTLHTNGNNDTTIVSFHTGDLEVMLTGNYDLGTLVDKLNNAVAILSKQIKADTTLHLQQLRASLPDIALQMSAARDNPIYNYLQERSIFFDRFTLDASTSPENGIQMNGLLSGLIKDTTKIDSVRFNLWQDTVSVNYTLDVVKNKFRRQAPFRAGLKGSLQNESGDVEVSYQDESGETGLLLGARAGKQADGIRVQFFPEHPVIAFIPFTLNKDNYVHIRKAHDISAQLRLDGDNYASLWLHSLENDSVMEELSVEISNINLNKAFKGFPTLPSTQGLANVSVRYIPMDESYIMVADLNVDSLVCAGQPIGELLMSGTYLPVDKNQHQVDMHLFHNRQEVSELSALYQSDKTGQLSGTMNISQFPLMIVNPFFAGQGYLKGTLQGNMAVTGTDKSPLLNGYIQTDTASVNVTAADANLRFDNQKVEIKDSRIRFNQFNIYSAGNNPFIINGTVDIRNFNRSAADIKLTTSKMQLLDAKKTKESIVYGKLFVDLNSTIKGPLNALVMRGNVHLLGNTNVTYIMKESPLTVRDRMDDLVTFSYFQDTIPRQSLRRFAERGNAYNLVTAGGMDMSMNIRIDPAVKIKVDLDEKSSNRIELEGGGDLSLQYTQQGDLLLTGRYTLSDGIIKYNMPVISNKTLNINKDSYIEWLGDPMDPYLNIKATERIRSSVNPDGQSARIVNSDAGVKIKEPLDNMDLQFTIDALDDATVQNQLAIMNADERSKQAVSLLLTGIYLSEGEDGMMKVDMGAAINHFLQSEINNVTNSLIKDVDFSLNMETRDNMNFGTGTGQRTDYSFRFSKRFYNDRFNVILGGVVSTGDVPSNAFINDASLEYQLDNGGNRYAKLFYNRKYESMLEGEITKYGTGLVFRRKMRRLTDIFPFRKRKTETEATDEKHVEADEK
ncbi:MAG: translocation/assembly module TamB [Tannerella sp.]|nr:translocation/assembly module TamB [Tannerella sp.]